MAVFTSSTVGLSSIASGYVGGPWGGLWLYTSWKNSFHHCKCLQGDLTKVPSTFLMLSLVDLISLEHLVQGLELLPRCSFLKINCYVIAIGFSFCLHHMPNVLVQVALLLKIYVFGSLPLVHQVQAFIQDSRLWPAVGRKELHFLGSYVISAVLRRPNHPTELALQICWRGRFGILARWLDP